MLQHVMFWGDQKITSIFPLGVAMKFVACYLVPIFLNN
jgi:hypothetical protein